MSKITLTNLGNLTNETSAIGTINSNSETIQNAFDNTLSRDGTSPNQMLTTFDMNNQRIINLPAPISPTEPVRLGDVTGLTILYNNAILVAPAGRLTLTSGVPMTEADVVNSATVYLTPVGSNFVEVYDGTRWQAKFVNYGGTGMFQVNSAGEFVFSLDGNASHTGYHQAGKNFFIGYFLTTSGGVGVATSVAWASNTSPGTGPGSAETEIFQGRLVNKYDWQVRYDPIQPQTTIPARQFNIVGGFRASSDGTTTDSTLQRFLSNIYNSGRRQMRVLEATATWAVPVSAGIRQVRAQTGNKVEWFLACAGRLVQAKSLGQQYTTTNYYKCGIGFNSTTLFAPNSMVDTGPNVSFLNTRANWEDYPGIGYGYAAWIEQAIVGDVVATGSGLCGLFATVDN